MEIGDLLLVIALVIVGLLALAYVVFGLGGQSNKQYLLTCPPCRANTPSTTVAPVMVPVGTTSTTASTTTSVPITPVIPLLPLAPANPTISSATTLLFRNRSNGKYLSVCSGCSSLDPLVVMANNSTASATYSQWNLISNTQGYLFATKFQATPSATTPSATPDVPQSAGAIQLALPQQIATIKESGNLFQLTPVDSNGYKIHTATTALKICCSASEIATCSCPQFTKDSKDGVTLIANGASYDATAIWDIFTYTEVGGVQSFLN